MQLIHLSKIKQQEDISFSIKRSVTENWYQEAIETAFDYSDRCCGGQCPPYEKTVAIAFLNIQELSVSICVHLRSSAVIICSRLPSFLAKPNTKLFDCWVSLPQPNLQVRLRLRRSH